MAEGHSKNPKKSKKFSKKSPPPVYLLENG
jgi:hypothetical protein